MSRIYYSAESAQQIITIPPYHPEDQESGNMTVYTDITAPKGELQFNPFGEHFLQSSLKKNLEYNVLTAIKTIPNQVSWVGVGKTSSRINFDASIGPWLPLKIRDLLKKMKKRALREKEAIRLMSGLANRASKHYNLMKGKFVAITFNGKIAEVADTKIGLLKKIQGKQYVNHIFVWKIGSESFTGWNR